MSTRNKRTTANSTKGVSSSRDEELNPSTLLTQGEALPESGAAHEAELAKLSRNAEELARTKKRLLAIQHEAEIQMQKSRDCRLEGGVACLKSKAILKVVFGTALLPFFKLRSTNSTMEQLHRGVRGACATP
jgi:hypothetical protein